MTHRTGLNRALNIDLISVTGKQHKLELSQTTAMHANYRTISASALWWTCRFFLNLWRIWNNPDVLLKCSGRILMRSQCAEPVQQRANTPEMFRRSGKANVLHHIFFNHVIENFTHNSSNVWLMPDLGQHVLSRPSPIKRGAYRHHICASQYGIQVEHSELWMDKI